jgi:hypothetical protein
MVLELKQGQKPNHCYINKVFAGKHIILVIIVNKPSYELTIGLKWVMEAK